MDFYGGGVLSFLGICLIVTRIACIMICKLLDPRDEAILRILSVYGTLFGILFLLIGGMQYKASM